MHSIMLFSLVIDQLSYSMTGSVARSLYARSLCDSWASCFLEVIYKKTKRIQFSATQYVHVIEIRKIKLESTLRVYTAANAKCTAWLFEVLNFDCFNQKWPGIKNRILGLIRIWVSDSQSIVDSFSCRRQSFRRGGWKCRSRKCGSRLHSLTHSLLRLTSWGS